MDCATLGNFQIENWRDLQPIEMRVATPEDVDNCNAVFSTNAGQTEVFMTLNLPALAVWTDELGNQSQVAVIQAEKVVGKEMVVVGLVQQGGVMLAATLAELEIIEQSP
jgi:hypothetical protein